MIRGEEYRSTITDFLDSNDIAHELVPGVFNFDIRATVPVPMLTQLAAFPGVLELLALPHPYPALGTYLNELVARYEAGLMPDEDASPTYARLVIGIEGNNNHDAVKRFLDEKVVVMVFADRDIEENLKLGLVAFVPVGLIVPLVNMDGVVSIWDKGYTIPAEQRYTRDSIYDEPTPTATPTSAASDMLAPPCPGRLIDSEAAERRHCRRWV